MSKEIQKLKDKNKDLESRLSDKDLIIARLLKQLTQTQKL
tara:strand:- start:660 stop:779 length:120 start_codon:yes stop_codon:yes gene_type:complete